MLQRFRKKINNFDWSKNKEKNENPSSEEENSPEETSKENSENNSEGANNKCWLVWMGSAPRANFDNFRFEKLENEAALKKYLNMHWSEPYWNMCRDWKEETLEL